MNYTPSVDSVKPFMLGSKEEQQSSRNKDRLLPVVEVFRSVQGEGNLSGVQTLFARLGLCDSDCLWCDSKHAVDPEKVKATATYMKQLDLATKLIELAREYQLKWVTLTGGNPAIYDLSYLVNLLQLAGLKIAVETQGTIYRDWLASCDNVVVSPKPPSSKMKLNPKRFNILIQDLQKYSLKIILKIPIFDRTDFDFARGIHLSYPCIPLYLSVGNPDTTFYGAGSDRDIQHRYKLLRRLEEITSWTLDDKFMRDVIVAPQLHVLMYGNKIGV